MGLKGGGGGCDKRGGHSALLQLYVKSFGKIVETDSIKTVLLSPHPPPKIGQLMKHINDSLGLGVPGIYQIPVHVDPITLDRQRGVSPPSVKNTKVILNWGKRKNQF